MSLQDDIDNEIKMLEYNLKVFDRIFGPKPDLSENDKLQAELKRDKAIEAAEEARRERNERNRTNAEDFERESGARP